MNSSQALTSSNYEEARKAIKKFLNDINDCMYALKNTYGYDTKELYITYDMLRYEIFTDKNIQLMCEDNSIDTVINKLNTFTGLLTNLMTELDKTKSKIKHTEAELDSKTMEKGEIKEGITEDLTTGIISIVLGSLLTGSLAIQPYMLKTIFLPKKIPANEYTIDNLGNI